MSQAILTVIITFIAGCQAPLWGLGAQRARAPESQHATPVEAVTKAEQMPAEEALPGASPATLPAVRAQEPAPLPFGIGATDPYENDPNAFRACDDAAKAVGAFHQRKGIAKYCKKRSWYARRGTKNPQRWVDGSYLHGIDVRAAEAMWRRAKKAGWINPEVCPRHRINFAQQMFTRGKWFDLSIYNARHLVTTHEIPCWDPAMMDRTDVDARVVAARCAKLCWKHQRLPCSYENLKEWWHDRTLK